MEEMTNIEVENLLLNSIKDIILNNTIFKFDLEYMFYNNQIEFFSGFNLWIKDLNFISSELNKIRIYKNNKHLGTFEFNLEPYCLLMKMIEFNKKNKLLDSFKEYFYNS